jgi:3'-phosphoadenosine 5'-phosphosulfate sulfotransferase (PAPS reductase)/FAD synthetase
MALPCPPPPDQEPDLASYDWILINTSGGKDSSAAASVVHDRAAAAGVLDRLLLAHATFEEEWPGTVALIQAQADQLGLPLRVVGRGERLLDYARRRGRWPSPRQRWCTSDFKRAPIDRIITSLQPRRGIDPARILNVMGIRAEESPARAKRQPFRRDERRSNSRRLVDEWYPIFRWTTAQVWAYIRQRAIPTHPAYGLGLPRLSCRFCIFAPRDALILAGHANPDLLREYAAVEREINHAFRPDLKIAEILDAVERGERPASAPTWTM